jgi:hypothetical protein
MKRSRISPMSKKRREALPQRQALRAEQLRHTPRCEAALHDCDKQACDVHEVINRSQRSTAWLEPEYFVSLCRPCHHWVTTNPLWSKQHGYTLSAYQYRPEWVAAAKRARATCASKTCLFDHLEEP